MTSPLRAVQIGAGSFCKRYHAPVLNRLASLQKQISLEAICDLDQKRAAEFSHEFGYARVYGDLERMVEELQPQLIYCMVHPAATSSVLEKLLPRGIPIFTEKPPGVTVEQADRLAELAQLYKTMNYVAFNRRAMPGILRLKSWAEENGPIRYLRAEMLRNGRLEENFAVATAIHALDCLRFLAGDVDEVETHFTPCSSQGAADFHVRILFNSGAIADLAVLVDCGLTRESYLAHCGRRMMEVTLGPPYSSSFCCARESHYVDETVEVSDTQGDALENGGFLGEHKLFLEAVLSGRLPNCCLQDARHSLRLATAVQRQYSGPLSGFRPELQS
jgi:predicted dehydrogenase